MLSCIWDNCHQCYIRNSWKKEENTHTNIYAHTGFETYSQMMIVCTEGRKQASKQADLWYNFCPLLKFGLVFLRDWRKGKITRNPRREVHKPTNLAMFLFACPFCSRALNSGKCLNWKKLGTQKVLDTQLVSGCIALLSPLSPGLVKHAKLSESSYRQQLEALLCSTKLGSSCHWAITMQCNNVGATKFQIPVKETASFLTTWQTSMEECSAIGVCLRASSNPTPSKHPFFIKSCCRIAQSLLLSGIAGPFCSGHFNPFKSSFLHVLWIWTVTITRPDVET
jgi:hypothetical protein